MLGQTLKTDPRNTLFKAAHVLSYLVLLCTLTCLSTGCGAESRSSDVPTAISSVSTRNDHILMLLSDGTIKSWGSNQIGQLGNGNTTDSNTPVTVAGLGGTATAIAAGDFHSLALMADGTVKAWGYNRFGQLGDGTYVSSSTPTTITALIGKKVIAIAAGGLHSMALLADGTVMEWGLSVPPFNNVPVAVSGINGRVIAIAAGFIHSVALLEDGTVKTWGSNYAGQLGNGSTADSAAPITVSGLGAQCTAIAAGYCHTVALLGNGTLKVWGNNTFGQLGDGTTDDSSVPISVTGLAGTVDSITAGDFHTMVLMQDATVRAWGNNASGQLGNGTTTNSSVPITVTGLNGIASTLFAGYSHSIVLMADGLLKAWGDNTYGQLGDGTFISRLSPETVWQGPHQ